MWHKPCRTFHPWCLCIKTRCLYVILRQSLIYLFDFGSTDDMPFFCYAMAWCWVGDTITWTHDHSGETDEANCSWLHPVWPPPKRPDQDSTFCVVSRASTELNFCIQRDFDVRNNVYKPRRLVCECCRDISTWKSRVMKPTVLQDPGRMKPTEYRDEANWFSNWTDKANYG